MPSGPMRQVALKTSPGHCGSDSIIEPRLDVDAVLARLRVEAFGVLVRDRNGQLLDQLLDGRKHGRRVRELREHDETNRQERRAARNGGVDHREHAIRVRAHLRSIQRIREVGLTGGGGIADGSHRIVCFYHWLLAAGSRLPASARCSGARRLAILARAAGACPIHDSPTHQFTNALLTTRVL